MVGFRAELPTAQTTLDNIIFGQKEQLDRRLAASKTNPILIISIIKMDPHIQEVNRVRRRTINHQSGGFVC